MQVIVDGTLTHYVASGSGKTVVLLHGWGDDSSTFAELSQGLSKKYTVLAVDLPGLGKSQSPPEAWGLYDYSKFISLWLKKINVLNVYCILGHSNGGAIAINGLANDQLKCSRLVLLASAGIRSNQKLKKTAFKAVAKTGKIGTFILPKNSQNKIRQKFYKSIGSEALLLPHMEETFKRIVAEDVRESAKNISIPTLLIYGDNDDSTPLSYGRALSSNIKNSDLRVISGVGHFPHQESIGKVSELVDDFLKDK